MKAIGRFVMRMLLRVHNALYTIISSLSLRLDGGVHPKHELMKYYEFFVRNISDGQEVLDIGCGYGQLAKKIAESRDVQITAIDIDERNIEKALQINPHQDVTYVHGDATTYDFKKHFDTLILSNVLEHIESRVEFLKRVRKHADTFLIRVPMIDRDWLTLYKQRMGVDYRLDPTHFIEFTMKKFIEETSAAGLKITDHYVQFSEIYAVLVKK